ncbi:MAG: B12-binding domain-containing protein [Ilumatobacteraceae bacterium]
MLNSDLTLHEVAEELGVHYMTAYRYVRLGLLPATKTGGSWRIRRTDLASFRSGSTATPVATGRRAPWAHRLESRLVAGDARGAWGVVEAALAAGSELDEIYLEVLSPALVRIGERWESGEIDIAIEHRATGIAMRLIGRLGPRFVRRGRTRGAVVLGAPRGERHGIPVAILADLLRSRGWDVSDLGADTPASSLAHTATSTADLGAVGLSVTHHENLGAATEACGVVRAADPGLLLVLGGLAVEGPEHAIELGGDRYAGSALAMIELLDEVAGTNVRTR